MRGLEERLRLALEGPRPASGSGTSRPTSIEWSDNMGPMYGLPARHPARRLSATSSTASCTPTTARDRSGVIEAALERRDAVRVRPARRAARQAACAGCTPVRARSATDGRTERITGLLSDVTERRHREDAREFLDAASQVLASSLDPVETLEEVAQLAVPRLADWCAVQLADAARRSPSPTSTPRRCAGRASCRSATRPIPTRRPARPP